MTYTQRHYTEPGSHYQRRIPYGKLTSRGLRTERALHLIGGTGLVLGLAGAAAFGIDVGVGAIAGSYGKQLPKVEAERLNMEKYNSTFQAAKPAGKFVMQYLKRVNTDQVEYPDARGLSAGTVETDGFGDGAYWQTSVGNACLNNTAYDIAGGNIAFNLTDVGLFSYVSASVGGNVPTAAAYAEIDPANPNNLIVQSGNDDSVALTFSGLEDKNALSLTPANEQTKNILATYGCSFQPTTSEVLNPGQ